jgi:transposase-like protein
MLAHYLPHIGALAAQYYPHALKDSTLTDGAIWRCPRCRGKKSIRFNSWFAGSKLALGTIMEVVYHWVHERTQKETAFETIVDGPATLVDFYRYCREICHETLELDNDSLGGPNKFVEIDEAKFGKRKFNRGRRVAGQWIFGMVERNSSPPKCVLLCVDSRDEDTLIPLIKKFILPDTTIVSDCWSSYQNLERHGYHHIAVNHSQTFKDPITGACTNTIEGIWTHAKRNLPEFGTRKHLYASYMLEFMYRKKYLNYIPLADRFPRFLNDIVRIQNHWNSVSQ